MMVCIRSWIAFRQDKRGITALEYGILAAIIAPLLVGASVTLSGGMTATLTMIAGHLTSGK